MRVEFKFEIRLVFFWFNFALNRVRLKDLSGLFTTMPLKTSLMNNPKFDSFIRKLLYICLALTPFLIVYYETHKFCEDNLNKLKTSLSETVHADLSKIAEVGDDHRFYHLLFKEKFEKVAHKPYCEKELKTLLEDLKNEFPDIFTFNIWDKNGIQIKSLSDDNNFLFLYRKLNNLLNTIKAETVLNTQNLRDFVAECDSELRLLRQIIGPFVTSEGLSVPFLDKVSARCFRLHGRGERTMGWYESYDNFSVLVFVSEKGRNNSAGPKHFLTKLSSEHEYAQFFILNENDQTLFPDSYLKNSILINLGKHRRMVPEQYLEDDNYLYRFQKADNERWAVAVINKNFFAAESILSAKVFTQLIAGILILFFVFYCFSLVNGNIFNSVRTRLIFVFLYAVFIPVLMFGTVGTDYINQKELQYLSDSSDINFQTLLSIDNQFLSYLKTRSNLLTSVLDRNFTYDSLIDLSKDLRIKTRNIIEQFSVDTVTVSNKTGEDLFGGEFSNTLKDDILRKTAAKEMLTYLNNSDGDYYVPSSGFAEAFLVGYNRIKNRMIPFYLSKETYISYIHTIREPLNKTFKYIVQLFWKERAVHSDYLEVIQKYANKDQEKKFVYTYPEFGYKQTVFLESSVLNDFFTRVKLNGNHSEKITFQNGKSYFAYGHSAQNLNGAVLSFFVSAETFKQESDVLYEHIFGLMFLGFLITFSLLYILSHYLIEPINKLSAGIDMIKRQNYTYRIDLKENNEFGRLANSIDESSDALAELEIAKTVQESLLPSSLVETSFFIADAKTRSMSNLCGDYYDFMVDSENNGIFLMSDVAGHGVQAALLMAMAKTVLMLNSTNPPSPTKIMKEINSTFYKLRKSKVSTMMTGQIISTDNEGNINFYNAGHCSPLIVSKKGLSVSAVQSPSKPFGFGVNREFTAKALNLEPGDTLILYSDGILETKNKSGEMLGIDGFNELALRSYDDNVSKYIDNLFDGYDKYTYEGSDDITFVLIRRKMA